MANQMSKMKPKQSIRLSKTSKLCFRIFITTILVLTAIISSVKAATCSSSVPSSAATTTEQCSRRSSVQKPLLLVLANLSKWQCSSSKKGGCFWLPNLGGFVSILSNPEESVCRCNWAKCVSCKQWKSSGGAQTISKWRVSCQSASVVSLS